MLTKEARLEILNTVQEHLSQQGEQSVALINGSKKCAYRGDRGFKCALGVLIKDEFYDPSFEGLSLPAPYATMDPKRSSLKKAIEKSLGVNELESDDTLFLNYLQRIHDIHTPTQWKKILEDTKVKLQEGNLILL